MTLPDIDDDHPATLSAPAALAGVLGANRDGASAAENSRGLLMTILGEYVMPDGGEVWTQPLLEALAGLGVRDKTARQTIERVHERGWLDRTRVGRQTRWHITPAIIRQAGMTSEQHRRHAGKNNEIFRIFKTGSL